jgi:hypothetical protein
MESVSASITENATKKRSKVHRSRPEIVRKVIAFQEIVNLTHNKRSGREAAHFLEVPNATMQSWMKRDNSNTALGQFFSTPSGADFLQRNVMAVMKLMKCGPCGIRGMQEYLLNSGLGCFVASSEGALQDFWKRCEDYILAFGEHEEKRLAVRMSHKKITAGLDEMFRGRRPCLVAIEVVSNYILVEKFTSDRKEETWNKELHDRIQSLNVTIVQVVSDLCGAIRACAKKFSAEHIPELFHAQHEICKAVSAPLASQARAAEQAASKAEEKVKKLSQRPLRLIKEERKQQECELKEAINNHNQLKIESETKRERQAAVSSAIREMGNIHHPIDLKTGKLQTAATMQKRFNEQFQLIEKRTQAARLTQSSIEKIAKAKRAFDGIINYMERFFIFYSAFLVGLQLTSA